MSLRDHLSRSARIACRHACLDIEGALEAQPIAHIVEADGISELREVHRREMAADGEMAGFHFNPRLPSVLDDGVDEPQENGVEQLLEDCNIGIDRESPVK